jgi:hypothetical protein
MGQNERHIARVRFVGQCEARVVFSEMSLMFK